MADTSKGNFLFSYLNQITFIKDPNFLTKSSEAELKQVNPFILNKWLSMNDDLLILADYLNPLIFNMTTEQVYKICLQLIPKRKMYFKWVGGTKKNKEHSHKFLVDLIKREYEISESEAIDYLELIQKNNTLLIQVVKKYPLEDKELKAIGLTRQQVHHSSTLDIKEVVSNYVVEKKDMKKNDEWENLFE